jgi:hypothetical protein
MQSGFRAFFFVRTTGKIETDLVLHRAFSHGEHFGDIIFSGPIDKRCQLEVFPVARPLVKFATRCHAPRVRLS